MLLDILQWAAVAITVTAAYLAWRRRDETVMFLFAAVVATITGAFRVWIALFFHPPTSLETTQQISILTGPILLGLVVIGFVAVAHYHTKNGNGIG